MVSTVTGAPDLAAAPISPEVLAQLASALFNERPGTGVVPPGVQAPVNVSPPGSPLASPAGLGPGVPGTPIPQGVAPGLNALRELEYGGRSYVSALARAGWTLDDVDLIEANEAFAAQALAVGKQLGWDERRVNVNGGAIALGHPIGASGCRILVTLLYEMKRRDVKKGLVTLCVGGGQGIALTVER